MDFVKVDTEWLRQYGEGMAKRADDVAGLHSALTEQVLEAEAFGELGNSLGTPAAYQRASDALYKQLEQAEKVLAAAATGVREVAGHYEQDDQDSAIAIEQKSTAGTEVL